MSKIKKLCILHPSIRQTDGRESSDQPFKISGFSKQQKQILPVEEEESDSNKHCSLKISNTRTLYFQRKILNAVLQNHSILDYKIEMGLVINPGSLFHQET